MDAACVLEKWVGTKIVHIIMKIGGRKINLIKFALYGFPDLFCK